MEQQQENVTAIPSNVVLPPPTVNIVSSPTNTIAPGIPLQSIPPMPPLGPAPTQLPPLVHPPPPTSGVPIQSVINTNATIPETQVEPIVPVQAQVEPIVPVQAQFETLNLNSPSIPNELGTSQELVDGDPTASPPIDSNAIVNPNGESSVPEEVKTGMYLKSYLI
jgi:hypothetical protein